MTNDKQQNPEQTLTICETKRNQLQSSFKNSKVIQKKTILKQQKQKLQNKCPHINSSSQMKNPRLMSKISSSSSLEKRRIRSLIASESSDSFQDDLSFDSKNHHSTTSQSSSFSSNKLNMSSVHTHQIKQEEEQQQQDNLINNCPFAQQQQQQQSPSKQQQQQQQQQQSNEDQLYIRNRINHEPMLFLHNKWDILPNKDYNIFGDILIETDFVSDKKFSSQNHWKPPLNVEIHPSRMIAKMNIGSYGTTMRDFSIISNFMKMCNHEEIQSYSYHLDKWQTICNKLVLQKQRSNTQNQSSQNNNNNNNNNNLEIEETNYEQRLRQFEQECEQKIQELNNEGKIFSYSKKRYNVNSQNLEEYEYGFNQYFLAIMGCEAEHLSTIIMRQGRPNFFDTKSRLKMSQQLVMNYLNINQSTSCQMNIIPEYLQKVNLITLDDLQVPSSAFSYCLNFQSCKIEDNLNTSRSSHSSSLQLSNSNSNQSSPLNKSINSNTNTNSISNNYNNTDYDFVLQIVELDIEAQHISTLLNIREFNDHEQKLNELKENIQYEFDIHVLLQKYYKPIHNNNNNNNNNNSITIFQSPSQLQQQQQYQSF